RAVGDGHIQGDELDAGPERRLLTHGRLPLRRRRRWLLRRWLLGRRLLGRHADRRRKNGKTREEGEKNPFHRRGLSAARSFTTTPRAVSPGRFDATVIRSGGINDSGCA